MLYLCMFVVDGHQTRIQVEMLYLCMFVVDGHQTRIQVEMPYIPAVFTGTGDLFSALLLAWLHIHSNDLKVDIQPISVHTVFPCSLRFSNEHKTSV